MNMRRLGFFVSVLGGSFFVAGQPAPSLAATYTTVNGLGGSGAGSHLSIFQDVFNSETWSWDGGLNFNSANLHAVRVADNTSGGGAGSNLLLGGTNYNVGGVTDQVWQDGTVKAVAEAKYADFNQSFGFFDGTGAGGLGSYNSVFRVTGGTASSPSQSDDLAPPVSVGSSTSGHTFQWGRAGWFLGWNNNQQSSRASNNLFGADHMVTYAVTDNSGSLLSWMLFFEDTNILPDKDFNDLVVQVTPVANVVAVPLPSAVLLGGVGLLGLMSVQLRRFLASR